MAVGEKHTYILSKHYGHIENDKIEEGTFINNTKNNLDPFAHHPEKCGEDAFQQIEITQYHTY